MAVRGKTNPAASATAVSGVAFQSGSPFHVGCQTRPTTAIATSASQAATHPAGVCHAAGAWVGDSDALDRDA